MYAAERVFAAAPPLYVVGLLLQLWWFPLQLLRFTDWRDELILRGRDISTAMILTGAVILVGASGELVRRSRGRVHLGMLLAFCANVLGLADQLSQLYLTLANRDLYTSTHDVFEWVTAIASVLAVVGLAVAAGRASLVTSLIVLVATAVVVAGPARLLVYQVGGAESLFWFSAALSSLRAVLLIAMVAAIAKQCSGPVHDHRRASRRFSVLAWLLAARAVFAGLMIAGAHQPGEIQVWLVAAETLLLALIVTAMWGIAQTQLPKLPRFSMHVAMAGVMISVCLVAQITESAVWFDDGVFHRHFRAIATWQLTTAAIGGAVWIVALWRFAKHAPAIKRSVVLAVNGFAAAIGYEQLVDDHLWVCEVIACAR